MTSLVVFHQSPESLTLSGSDLPESFNPLLKELAFDPNIPLRATDHSFNLGELIDDRPVQQPLRNLPKDRKDFLVKWIKETKALDLIEDD